MIGRLVRRRGMRMMMVIIIGIGRVAIVMRERLRDMGGLRLARVERRLVELVAGARARARWVDRRRVM